MRTFTKKFKYKFRKTVVCVWRLVLEVRSDNMIKQVSFRQIRIPSWDKMMHRNKKNLN